MKKLFLLFLVFTATVIHAQEQSTLQVVGYAEAEVLPDLMQFDLNFNVNSDTQKESIEELNALIDDVIAALTKAGIEADSIKTDNFRTSVVDNTYRNGKNYFTSQQNMYFIMNADSDDIITILNVLNNVEGNFNFSPSPKISASLQKEKQQALTTAAFENAKINAELLSISGGFSLKGFKSIDFDLNRPPRSFSQQGYELKETALPDDITTLNFGHYNLAPQKIFKRVNVTYIIEQ